MSVNRRVELLIPKVAANKSSFSKATGISAVIISHICSGRNKVSLAAITQILEAYPSVNPNWLILGKGSMFISNATNNEALLNVIEDLKKQIKQHNKEIDAQLNLIISQLS